jgi:hypothetical protein
MATTGEQSFAPQVRDTRLGPNIHNYIPRADGAIVVGGIAYYPEGPKPAAIAIPTSLPVPVTTAAGQPTMVHLPAPHTHTHNLLSLVLHLLTILRTTILFRRLPLSSNNLSTRNSFVCFNFTSPFHISKVP